MIDTWTDSLVWNIRPDCRAEAREVLERVQSKDALASDIDRTQPSGFIRMDDLPVELEGRIAIVSVVGPLVNRFTWWTANYPALTAAFEQLRDLRDVRAVLVRFKTPGGTVSGLHECAEALSQLAETKLTVAQVDGGCYSAGYYLACMCGSIFCGPTDHVGNIGTITSLYDYSEMFQSAGVRPVTKRTGEIKGVGIMGEPVTTIQEAFLDTINKQHFEHFRDAVMTGRDMNDEEFAAVSDGSWWLGNKAIGLNIIDGVSSFKQTLGVIQQQAA